ncbi:Uncharacterized protein OS=Singulisphaera acidiphila (strain ATCC BAA-1392 / DSM 18658 / VKM B-2454 / MOB10) GN=Sinac_6794 PE=4 SV=1 [Gemmataceae bacterium]|nr:Uncharacterized protein OS=Singulisphaera acidiphila (strain ATCC BAA-1392 / DSM 18658 / VKM B-2454 / MOB10) GN=Sinac_6794 PE=4 SV=1 [Gemmataceae bacterium]VTT98671.1 Uncharacterized protein OS=Singulisphaera acidiphila (strain ATCC BAA-1392 / DSM 18658 / VKM B-2454 / MOB10) GN=Sinac_6794 PE=4 SV=1 [Gemmataceae bacterium]
MRLFLTLILCTAVAAQPAEPTIKPTAVSVGKDATLAEAAAALTKSPVGAAVQIGAPDLAAAKVGAGVERVPFWDALEAIADQTKSRLALRDGGRTVALAPRSGTREVSAVSGAFRIVPRAVTGRLLLDQGTTLHDIDLDVHWEPRVRVYRIDSAPQITKAVDDRGTALTAAAAGSRHYPTDSLTDLKVRLTGLTRDGKQIATLAGEFRATAAEGLLSVPFKNLAAKFPIAQKVGGMSVVLRSFEKVGGFWEAQLELAYPEGHPAFESFEEQKWLRDTRVRLIDPTAAVFEPDNDDVNAAGRNVAATYRFKLLAAANPLQPGWSLVCDTPAPLAEVKVPFVLKNIPLP